MKYYKTNKFTKALTSTGFVSMVACALIAVGAIAWFTLSRDESIAKTPSQNDKTSSYPDIDSSYNSNVNIKEENEAPVEDVAESEKEVPYEEQSEVEKVQEEITYILPVKGKILKNYSDSALQYSATYGDMRLHTGIDIECPKGTNILSVSSGTVKSVVEDASLGRVITIEYAKSITVKYCGMGSVNVVEGDAVRTGDVIGTSGDIPSECTDNPHIHIEVFIDGKSISPLKALGLE